MAGCPHASVRGATLRPLHLPLRRLPRLSLLQQPPTSRHAASSTPLSPSAAPTSPGARLWSSPPPSPDTDRPSSPSALCSPADVLATPIVTRLSNTVSHAIAPSARCAHSSTTCSTTHRPFLPPPARASRAKMMVMTYPAGSAFRVHTGVMPGGVPLLAAAAVRSSGRTPCSAAVQKGPNVNILTTERSGNTL